MSRRSLVEINHDFCPRGDTELVAWAQKMLNFIRGGDKHDLPQGVEMKWSRHHSDPCPFDQPVQFERRFPRSRDNA